MTIGTC